MRQSRGSAASNFVVVAASLCVALLLAELAARATYERPWYESLLDEQESAEKHGYDRRRDGLRDRDYPSPKPADRRRILLLGDSFTFGIGVHDEAAIFPEILERRLDAQAASWDASGIDLLNGGIPGSLTTRWLGLAKRAGRAFEPDAIVAVFFLRDGTRLRAKEDFFEPIRDEIAGRNDDSALYQRSALVRFVTDRLDQREVSSRYLAKFRESYFGEGHQSAEWRKAQKNLLEIREIAREDGAAFGIVVFPLLMGFQGKYPLQDVCDTIVAFGEAHEIPTLDLLPAFQGERASDLWVSALNQHANARGHELVANAMEPFLKTLLEERASVEAPRVTE